MIASATAPFRARVEDDVGGAIGGDPRDRRPRQRDAVDELGSGGDRLGVEPVRSGDRDEVGAVRRAEELLEAIVGQRRRLRQEREDAAAVVVDDDDAQIGVPAHAAP